MRSMLLLFALSLCSLLQAGSPYRPFPERNAGWVESHNWMGSDANGFILNTCTRTIRFGSDTVIDGTTYHRLYTRGQGTWQTSDPPQYGNFTEPDRLFTPFRQDVDARKVYAYDTLLHQERLWFDFTLGVGPYPETFGTPNADHIEVVALDSMQLEDGYHRTWVLGVVMDGQITAPAFCTIIEGVGPTFGLNTVLGLVPPFEWSDMLYCHQSGPVTVFSITHDGPCDLSMDVAEVRPAVGASITASPNPTAGRVRLNNARPDDTYAVLDATGRMHHGGRVGTGELDLAGLPGGMYLIRVQQAGVQVGTVRVIRE
ncbi:MAG: T9SS type A sorting domain-containing protein [Flavobacteriales bacterium]